MTLHNFLSLLKHDVVEGILYKWKFFLVAILFFVFADFVFVVNVNSLFAGDMPEVKCSVTDIIINMFLGNEAFDFESKKGINLSIIWFAFHALLFSFIGYYISDDLKKNATSFILRVKSKRQWWTSKFLWCVITVIVYYFLFFIVALIVAFLGGTLSFNASSVIADVFFEIQIYDVSVCNIIFSSLLLPATISVSIATFEASLSLILKPVYSFVIVISYLAISAFYCSAFFVFNFSMLIKNNFNGVNGVLNQYGVLIAVFITVISYFIGLLFIKKKDIL